MPADADGVIGLSRGGFTGEGEAEGCDVVTCGATAGGGGGAGTGAGAGAAAAAGATEAAALTAASEAPDVGTGALEPTAGGAFTAVPPSVTELPSLPACGPIIPQRDLVRGGAVGAAAAPVGAGGAVPIIFTTVGADDEDGALGFAPLEGK